jgi:hypothetical protein
MSGSTPPFDEIVDRDDPERVRLQATHDLLVAAGAPPELPPSLGAAPPEPEERVLPFRRRYTAVAAVAVAALVLFGIGYTVGGRGKPPEPVRTVALSGPAGASATIDLQPIDAEGNWPMILGAEGLPALRQGETYTLWLTRGGELADPCGTFAAGQAAAEIWLNAPYELKTYDGWVVVRTGTTTPFLLRTTTV